MDVTSGTEALRAAAPEWSLAGDRQLLTLLQNIHQKIMTKCQETNSQLEAMVSALDIASVSLQNVNNRFMALSNSQFIESRVYDDDTDISTDTAVNEPEPAPAAAEALPALLAGVATLQRLHSRAEIQDSDSDSADEDSLRTVLIPKNMYSDRRLPYIIGSNNWKSRRHAGLMSDESDSASSGEEASLEQYSNSDTDEHTDRQARKIVPTISTSSSEQLAPISTHAQPVAALPTPPRSQSDIAAELARRLGGGAIPESIAEEINQPVMPRQLYKPQPNAAAIFFDEPPPLDRTRDSDVDSHNESDDEDIFAEINRKAPYADTNEGQIRTSGITAGRLEKTDGIFDDIQEVLNEAPEKLAAQQPTLFGDEEDSDLFARKPPSEPQTAQRDTIKKPTGAISLFGSNQHAETIGAAILKRSRRKSNSSGESNLDHTDSSSTANQTTVDTVKSRNNEAKAPKSDETANKREVIETNVKSVYSKEAKLTETPKERDIFDDLFAKSEKNVKKVVKTEISKTVNTKPKVDIFSDDIFDDIDDIFNSDIVITKTEKKSDVKKSLFDDVDDLFSEVSAEKNITKIVKNDKLFDSDDELFNDKPRKKTDINEPEKHKKENKEPDIDRNDIFAKTDNNIKENDNDIFSNKTSALTQKNIVENPLNIVGNNEIVDANKKSHSLFDSDDELFSNQPITSKINEVGKILTITSKSESKTLPDDDYDIFSNIKPPMTNESKPKISTDIDEIYTTSKQFSEEYREKNNAEFKDDPDDAVKSDEWSDDNCQKAELTTSSLKTVLKETKIDTVMKVPSCVLSNDDDEKMDYLVPQSKDVLEGAKTSYNNSENDSTKVNYVPNTEIACRENISEIGVDNAQNVNKTIVTKLDNNICSDNNIDNINSIIQDQSLNSTNVNDPITKEEEIISKPQDLKSKTSIIDLDNTQTNLDNNKNIEDCNMPKSIEKADIFDDIFADQPPAFEKPKEKKKSQNINALFDDDSDDEALFLRKTDNFTDEKPDEFAENQEPVFTIFHDEPPAIDADLIPKTVKTIQPTVSETLADQKRAETVTDKLDGGTQSITEEAAKPIGKLKPLNFSINVNSLLPGASPKKIIKPSSNDDSTPSSPDLSNDFEDTDSKTVKIVSFVGNPDSTVLDNKISKERAKIQVKRRPSTRRARKEAARKSAIDFADVTDGSSMEKEINDYSHTDEIKKVAYDTVNEKVQVNKLSEKNSEMPQDMIAKDELHDKNTIVAKDDAEIITAPNTHVLNINDDDVYIFRDPITSPRSEKDQPTITEPTSSIKTLGKVYETKINDDKKLNIIDDGDDFFKGLIAKDTKPIPKQPSKSNIKTASKSLFDNMSDDENLFGNVAKNVFLNDSDEELFASGSSKKGKEISKIDVKKSLFDDDDEDDDIFGDKTKTASSSKGKHQEKQASKAETSSKPGPSVFVDPLSLFGSDDDL